MSERITSFPLEQRHDIALARAARGVCIDCGQPVPEGRTFCQPCVGASVPRSVHDTKTPAYETAKEQP